MTVTAHGDSTCDDAAGRPFDAGPAATRIIAVLMHNLGPSFGLL
jgi:hypothetical protein